jgi:acyl carrier protein
VATDEQLRQVFAAVLKVEPDSLGDDSSIHTIESWDSLQHMILMVALEEEFGISIPEEVAAEAASFTAIKGVVENLTREGVSR